MPNTSKPAELHAAKAPPLHRTDSEIHASDERRHFPRTLPVPDVVEGTGGDTDWALWTELVQQQQQEIGVAAPGKSA